MERKSVKGQFSKIGNFYSSTADNLKNSYNNTNFRGMGDKFGGYEDEGNQSTEYPNSNQERGHHDY